MKSKFLFFLWLTTLSAMSKKPTTAPTPSVNRYLTISITNDIPPIDFKWDVWVKIYAGDDVKIFFPSFGGHSQMHTFRIKEGGMFFFECHWDDQETKIKHMEHWYIKIIEPKGFLPESYTIFLHDIFKAPSTFDKITKDGWKIVEGIDRYFLNSVDQVIYKHFKEEYAKTPTKKIDYDKTLKSCMKDCHISEEKSAQETNIPKILPKKRSKFELNTL